LTALRNLAALGLLISTASVAVGATTWTKGESTPDGDGSIYFSTAFTQKTGTFKATPESMLDKKDTVTGTFVVGTYRIVSKQADQDINGTAYDELIATELMDCTNAYYGRIRTVEKLKGKVVSDQTTPDHDIQMTEQQGPTIDSQLCQLHQGKPAGSLDPTANPDYNPNPSDQDLDKIIDKHLPAKTH
jgi:hypothetical protein